MKTVLIVDDEYALAEALRDFLEEEGFAVITAGNGEQALAQVTQRRPALLLMDIMMPVLDGLEAARRIRAKPEFDDLPILLMSSAARSTLDPSLEAMISGFFKKPPRLQPLLDAIRRLTGAPA